LRLFWKLLLFSGSVDLYHTVQRAYTDYTGKNCDSGNDQKDNSQCSCYYVGEIKNNQKGSDQQPYDFVNSSYILFHGVLFLLLNESLIDLKKYISAFCAWAVRDNEAQETAGDRTHDRIAGNGAGSGRTSDKMIVQESRSSSDKDSQKWFPEIS
jgi:hypothetical protein